MESESSTLFGASIRAWLALMIIGTICFISIVHSAAVVYLVVKGELPLEELKIVEPLYSLGGMALGFYFGQKMVKGSSATG